MMYKRICPVYPIGSKVLMGPEKQQEEWQRKQNNDFTTVTSQLPVYIASKGNDLGFYWVSAEHIPHRDNILVHESQILGYAFEPGERIEVKDGGIWHIWRFSAYAPSPGRVTIAAYSNSKKNRICLWPQDFTRPVTPQVDKFQLSDDLESIPVLNALLKRHEDGSDLLTTSLSTAIVCIIAAYGEPVSVGVDMEAGIDVGDIYLPKGD